MGPFEGSLVAIAGIPTALSQSISIAAWVVEPAPSIPSMTISAPGWRFGGFTP
jgi:hypothetical protein